MKHAIIIPDGAADQPQESLGGKTPLEAANTPNMDALAAAGVVARACHTPDELPAGSEIGNLSLLGYDPFEHFTGRAPMEAAAANLAERRDVRAYSFIDLRPAGARPIRDDLIGNE